MHTGEVLINFYRKYKENCVDNEILKLKDHPSVVCYVETLQGNISRMGAHSSTVKASTCVIYTIVITAILSTQNLDKYWWITILITIFMAILDSYYLAIERTYRDKYGIFISELNLNNVDFQKIYDMEPKTTSLKCEIMSRSIYALRSFSVVGFYGVFIAISVIIHLI